MIVAELAEVLALASLVRPSRRGGAVGWQAALGAAVVSIMTDKAIDTLAHARFMAWHLARPVARLGTPRCATHVTGDEPFVLH